MVEGPTVMLKIPKTFQSQTLLKTLSISTVLDNDTSSS